MLTGKMYSYSDKGNSSPKQGELPVLELLSVRTQKEFRCREVAERANLLMIQQTEGLGPDIPAASEVDALLLPCVHNSHTCG